MKNSNGTFLYDVDEIRISYTVPEQEADKWRIVIRITSHMKALVSGMNDFEFEG